MLVSRDFIHWAISPAHNFWPTFGTRLLPVISHSVCSWEYRSQTQVTSRTCAHPATLLLWLWARSEPCLIDGYVHVNACRGGQKHNRDTIWRPEPPENWTQSPAKWQNHRVTPEMPPSLSEPQSCHVTMDGWGSAWLLYHLPPRAATSPISTVLRARFFSFCPSGSDG